MSLLWSLHCPGSFVTVIWRFTMADHDSFCPFWHASCWPQKPILFIFEAGYTQTSELVCSQRCPVSNPPAICTGAGAGAGTDYPCSGLCIHQPLHMGYWYLQCPPRPGWTYRPRRWDTSLGPMDIARVYLWGEADPILCSYLLTVCFLQSLPFCELDFTEYLLETIKPEM